MVAVCGANWRARLRRGRAPRANERDGARRSNTAICRCAKPHWQFVSGDCRSRSRFPSKVSVKAGAVGTWLQHRPLVKLEGHTAGVARTLWPGGGCCTGNARVLPYGFQGICVKVIVWLLRGRSVERQPVGKSSATAQRTGKVQSAARAGCSIGSIGGGGGKRSADASRT